MRERRGHAGTRLRDQRFERGIGGGVFLGATAFIAESRRGVAGRRQATRPLRTGGDFLSHDDQRPRELARELRGFVGERLRVDEVALLERLLGFFDEALRLIVLIRLPSAREPAVVDAFEIAVARFARARVIRRSDSGSPGRDAARSSRRRLDRRGRRRRAAAGFSAFSWRGGGARVGRRDAGTRGAGAAGASATGDDTSGSSSRGANTRDGGGGVASGGPSGTVCARALAQPGR